MAHELDHGGGGYGCGAAAASRAGDRPTGPVATLRVLLVEDNRNLRVTTSRMLEHLGYAVEAVGSGAEAVEAFRGASRRPDVVLVDLLMPGMDGAETIRALRAIAPGVAVVAVSGAAEDLDRARTEDSATAVLPKPYDIDALAAVLRDVAGSS